MKVWRVCIAEPLGPPVIGLVTEIEGKIYMAHCSPSSGGCSVRPETVYPVRDFPKLAQRWLDGVLSVPDSAAKFPVDDVPDAARRLAQCR